MSDTNGRTKATVLLTLAGVLLAGMTGQMALGWGDGAALRATVLQAIAAMPTQPPPAESANDPQGTPATAEQRQAIEGALVSFLKAMQGHDFAAAGALVTSTGQDKERWAPSPYYKRTGNPFTDRYAEIATVGHEFEIEGNTLPTGTRLELLRIMNKPEKCALLGLTVDRTRWIAVSKSPQGWRIDIDRTDDQRLSETLRRQLKWANETAGTLQPTGSYNAPGQDDYFGLLVLSPENTYQVEQVLCDGDQAWVKLQAHSRVLTQSPVSDQGGFSGYFSLLPGPVDPNGYATSKAREAAMQQSCLSNLKQLQLGMLQYCQDYDERMPIADRWSDSIDPYVKIRQTFICPVVPDKPGYAMNYKLSRQQLSIVSEPARTICLFESSLLTPNAYDVGKPAGYSLASPGRHRQADNVGYADGHARLIGVLPPGKMPLRAFQVVRPPAPKTPAWGPGGAPGGPGGPPVPGVPGYDDDDGGGKKKSGGDDA